MPTITIGNKKDIVSIRGLAIYDKYLATFDDVNLNGQQCIHYLNNKKQGESLQKKFDVDSLTIIIRNLYEKNVDYNTLKQKKQELSLLNKAFYDKSFWDCFLEHLDDYVKALKICERTEFWIDEKTKTDNHTLIIDMEYTALNKFVLNIPEEFRVIIDLDPILLDMILTNGEEDFHRLLCKHDLFFNDKTMNLLFDNYEKYKFCQLNCEKIIVPNEYLKIHDYNPFDEESDEDITIEEMQDKFINDNYDDTSDEEFRNDYFPLFELKRFIDKHNVETSFKKILPDDNNVSNIVLKCDELDNITKFREIDEGKINSEKYTTNDDEDNKEEKMKKNKKWGSKIVNDKKEKGKEKVEKPHVADKTKEDVFINTQQIEKEIETKMILDLHNNVPMMPIITKIINDPFLVEKGNIDQDRYSINIEKSNTNPKISKLRNQNKLTKEQKTWRKKIFKRNYFRNIDCDFVTSSHKKHVCNNKIVPNKKIHTLIFIVQLLLLSCHKEEIFSMKIKYVAKMYYEMTFLIIKLYNDETTKNHEITISALINVKDDCVKIIHKYNDKKMRHRCSITFEKFLNANNTNTEKKIIKQYDVGTYGYFVNIMNNLSIKVKEEKTNTSECSYIIW